ncbi:glycosyltransferase family 2 protein [Pseudomonas alkylphenolica]|uniref:Glycosyl transferase, family 2 n=1 Tax=Pseudomonas alkylphenolica TaxID=237609 RepID=A0A077F546_9PSED|nr:glycosyltransferase family 2 protein [Pseudomonas alkylphenolica]AIL60612.1 glycosyl transferase, family 2 [Pseudomonas alkylphenolica]
MPALNTPTRFSIVIPTYNSAATVQRTLESITMQQWPNVEIVIVDGVSTDDTLAVVERNAVADCIVISEPDKGIYDAINKGVARATGQLICVIGSDDQFAAGAFRAVNDAWQAEHADIVAGPALLVALDGQGELRKDERFGPGALLSGIPFCHNAMFVTSAAYASVGPYNINYRICADAEWVHRSIRLGCSCLYIDKTIVHFSLSGTSSTNDELIMKETYAVIVGNFPMLSTEDAEILFRAVRGWSDGSQVASVLSRHSNNKQLMVAANDALRLHPRQGEVLIESVIRRKMKLLPGVSRASQIVRRIAALFS